ncbi:helix-turn-helix domain-containing protein [Enterovirga rhinocerotis]|uniref:AraC family transcriptional regulator n=1 Tax=Enterovirga rhinocerotis TaxID=1339210 RepID=A0A4R7BYA2_9HYPH|nr:helix-turn-helix domain-containing protein [Enterovirga rhinocerotis]TDR90232.1 AraC family transcriptional regulator [Enterovirga rhinocerotis]
MSATEIGLSTDMVDRSVRTEFWRDVSSILYDITPVDDGRAQELTGSVQSQPFGSMILGHTTFNRQICRRTPKIIVRSALDFYIVQLVLSGDYRGDFNGVNFHARPGDVFILDLAQVLDSEKEAGARISLVLPRPVLDKCLPGRRLHGLILDRRRATTRLLADYLIGIEKVVGDLAPNEIPAVQESVSVLLASAVEGAGEHRAPLTVSRPMRQRILYYIDSNLGDPLLGPDRVMRRFRVSRSHLYRAFEPDGGVARIIRAKRLDHAYHLLRGSAGGRVSVKEVARRCGISEGTDFAKSFKVRFGLTPSQLRGVAATARSEPQGPFLLHEHLLTEAARNGL